LAIHCLFIYLKKRETSWTLQERREYLWDTGVSKAFRIYILGHRHIEIIRDVTFDEEAALKKSRRCQLEEVYEEEPVNPRIVESVREVPRAAEPVREVVTSPDEETPEDHNIIRSSRTSSNDLLP
jgi:hypothetical protein